MSDETLREQFLPMSNAALKLTDKTNAEYMELMEKLDDIPTLPVVPMKVNELVNDPNSSGSDVAEVLKKDQVLTAKILKLANSSYYSIPGGVSDVQRALAFLGFNTIAQLILGLSVLSMFEEIDGEDFTMLDFWKHALGTAVCSEILAKKTQYPKPEEVFTCGLLHDIGKLVLNQIDSDRFRSINKEAKENEAGFYETEIKGDLPSHTFLGEMIAEKWNLPVMIRLAIRYHHSHVEEMSTLLDSEKPVIQMVSLANKICVKNEIGKSGDYSKAPITESMLKPLGLTLADLPEIEEKLEKSMESAGAFLGVYR